MRSDDSSDDESQDTQAKTFHLLDTNENSGETDCLEKISNEDLQGIRRFFFVLGLGAFESRRGLPTRTLSRRLGQALMLLIPLILGVLVPIYQLFFETLGDDDSDASYPFDIQVQYVLKLEVIDVHLGPAALWMKHLGASPEVVVVAHMLISAFSHMYVSAVFYLVCCIFCLVCSLHILKLRWYMYLVKSTLSPVQLAADGAEDELS
eukprot:gene11879-14031_t